MRPDISLPDAPLNTCPAAFLTGQAALIAELHAQAGATRWVVPLSDFAGALYRSSLRHFDGPPPEGDSLGTYLRGLHLADLALACALQLGSEAAWEDFVGRFRPALYSAARAIAGARGEAHARELADALYGELYGLDRDALGRRRSLLRYFHGRSKLLTWLRTVLAQRHVDSLRAGRNMDSLEDEAPASGTGPKRGRTQTALFVTRGPSGPGGASETGDPDRARLLPRLQETLLVAFEALAPSDRLLLAMYYLDQQTLAQIARMRSVHEATVSRQLERIRRELRERVESALAAPAAPQNGTVGRKGLSAAEIDLCLQYAVEENGCFDVSQALSGSKQHTAIQQPKPAVAEQDEKG